MFQRRIGSQQERDRTFEAAPGNECPVGSLQLAADQAERSHERSNEKHSHDRQEDAVADVIEADERREGCAESCKEQRLRDG